MQNSITRFEILKEMESFTEDMFNRIIEFQEKQHAAWNKELAFEERIKGLPLHYLVFSNADRNPETHGPTVAHYYPLREEMLKIIHYAKQVADHPVICDLHARNGFIGSLLAREGGKQTRVIGLRDANCKPNQIEDFFDPEFFQFHDAADENFHYDVAFSSWLPTGHNLNKQLADKNPKLVVFIYTDHTDVVTGQRQTGTDTSFTKLPEHYTLIDEWSTTRPKDLFHAIWPDLTGNLQEKRQVRIYASVAKNNIEPYNSNIQFEPYDWERELEMATIAHQAKESLKERWVPV